MKYLVFIQLLFIFELVSSNALYDVVASPVTYSGKGCSARMIFHFYYFYFSFLQCFLKKDTKVFIINVHNN